MSNLVPFNEIQKMAEVIAKSKFFGMKTADETMALMLIAQAEGKHPATAAQEYHVIQGKPALKADAMLARFQAAGGKVSWQKLDDREVTGIFSHPSGGSATITWTIEMAKKAQLTGKSTWNQYPRQMLRARVVSEGIRTVYPGVAVGVYTPEEVQDFTVIENDPTDTKPPVFKNSSLRNKFCKNVIESFDAATSIAELEELSSLNAEKLEEMKASGNEYDALAVDEIRNRYKQAAVRIKQHDASQVEAVPDYIAEMDNHFNSLGV